MKNSKKELEQGKGKEAICVLSLSVLSESMSEFLEIHLKET